MLWINLKTSQLREAEFMGSDPIDRATWLCLISYCVDQENGGRINGAAHWKDRQWQQTCSITREELERAKLLIVIDGDDVVVWGYPIEAEEKMRESRKKGKDAADRRWAGKTKPAKTPAPVPGDDAAGNASGIAVGIATGNTKRKEKEEEGERNEKEEESATTTTTAATTPVSITILASPGVAIATIPPALAPSPAPALASTPPLVPAPATAPIAVASATGTSIPSVTAASAPSTPSTTPAACVSAPPDPSSLPASTPEPVPLEADEPWLRSVAAMDCYRPLRMREEFARAQVWAQANGRPYSRKFLLAWLNRSLADSRAQPQPPAPLPAPFPRPRAFTPAPAAAATAFRSRALQPRHDPADDKL